MSKEEERMEWAMQTVAAAWCQEKTEKTIMDPVLAEEFAKILVAEVGDAEKRAGQLEVQLAGCLTAAEGCTKEPNVAKQGDYGWSLAYQAVLDLRRKFDDFEHEARMMKELREEIPYVPPREFA